MSEPKLETRSHENRRIVRANGVDICLETFGDRADPAILLIHGATTSMMGWADEFCQRLAAGNCYIIRYDHRDTGQSVSYEPGAPPYSLPDLTADAIGLLDALDLDSANLAGISMGGGIAMLAALDYPERVASLTLIGTSPGGPDLPPMSEEFLRYIRRPEQPDWSDRDAVVESVIEFLHICSGSAEDVDETEMRELIGQDIDRTTNIASSQINHFSMNPGDPIRDRLPEIAAPTLIIHGASDPIFPPGHARALQREIPNARLLVLDQAGHLLTRPTWETVIPAMLEHTKANMSSRTRRAAPLERLYRNQ